MCGYIKLHRQILEWEWYSDVNTKAVFFHLLLKASTKNRIYKGISIKKGQLIAGRKSLAEDLGLSERNIRTSLDRLKKGNEIDISTNNKYSIITVKKWSKYQENQEVGQYKSNNSRPTNDQQPTNKRPTADQQTTTVKERENDILENNNLTVITKKSENNYSQKVKPSRKTGTRFQSQRDSNQYALIPNEFLTFANQEGFSQQQASREFQNFADYWEARAGSQGIKLDWLATWRSWVRRSHNQPSNNSKQGTLEAMKEVDCIIEQHGDIRPQSLYTQGA